MWSLYKITCIGNNKVYIGITLDVRRRFYRHLLNASKNKNEMALDYNYYGKSSFKVDVLLTGLTNKKARELEIKAIEYYNSYYDGYNSSKGGEKSPTLNKKFSERGEYTQYLIRTKSALYGRKNGFYGKHHSDESKLKIVNNRKKHIWSDYEREQVSLRFKGIPKELDTRIKMSLARCSKLMIIDSKVYPFGRRICDDILSLYNINLTYKDLEKFDLSILYVVDNHTIKIVDKI